jgi:hypothetical protein
MNAVLEEEKSVVSQARVDANRRNAQLSTGPKTEQGKAIARRNALQHGLTGAGIVMLEEDELEFHAEVEKWIFELKPKSELDILKVETMVRAKVRIKRADQWEAVQRRRIVERAVDFWVQDQRLAVERLAEKLPKARTPALIVEGLRQTPRGCDWVIERWEELERALELEGDWNEELKTLAFDLLGAPRGTRAFSNRLRGDATLEDKQMLVYEQIEAWTETRDNILEELDLKDQQRAIHGVSWDDSAEGRRIRAYESANSRIFQKMLAHFSRQVKGDGDSDEDEQEEAAEVRHASPAEARKVWIAAGLTAAPYGSPTPLSTDPEQAPDPRLAKMSAEELVALISPDYASPFLLEHTKKLIAAREAARGAELSSAESAKS